MQSCPRRLTEYGPWEKAEDLDDWRYEPRREGELVPFCSFCGSLNPEKFLDLVTKGWLVGPTDKNYKAYLHQESSIPEGVPMESGESSSEPARYIQSKFYYQHLSPEQQRQFINLYNEGTMRIGNPGYFYVPPFFMRVVPSMDG